MPALRYSTWPRSLLAPRERLLPGVGVRLGRHPDLAVRVFVALRQLPTRRLRAAGYRHVAVPLSRRMEGRFRTPVDDGFDVLVDLPSLNGLLLLSGVWEWHTTAVFRRLLRAGDVFVDVGANIGYYTTLGSRLVGDVGHVYALEPAPETYATLRETLDRNEVRNVTALQVAAGAEASEATLFGGAVGHDEMSTLLEIPEVRRTRRPEHAAGEGSAAVATAVQVVRLSDVVSPSDLPRLALVKVDVEGYEAAVLRGLEPVFDAGHRPTLLIEVHADLASDAAAAVESFATRYGLRAFWIVDDEGLDYRHAPADREGEVRDLGSPPDLDVVSRGRYVVALTGEAERPEHADSLRRATTASHHTVSAGELRYRTRCLAKAGVAFRGDERLLDVGCGNGGVARLLRPQVGEVVAVDLEPAPDWKDEPGLTFMVADGERLPFEDASFDVVHSKDSLHHMEDPAAALAEYRRVLRPGGMLVAIEGNRFNPVFYVHMTKLLGHEHFSRGRFHLLVREQFPDARFGAFEAHYVPWGERLLGLQHVIEEALERIPGSDALLSYNVAVARRTT